MEWPEGFPWGCEDDLREKQEQFDKKMKEDMVDKAVCVDCVARSWVFRVREWRDQVGREVETRLQGVCERMQELEKRDVEDVFLHKSVRLR